MQLTSRLLGQFYTEIGWMASFARLAAHGIMAGLDLPLGRHEMMVIQRWRF